jgi:hypothetical protein
MAMLNNGAKDDVPGPEYISIVVQLDDHVVVHLEHSQVEDAVPGTEVRVLVAFVVVDM